MQEEFMQAMGEASGITTQQLDSLVQDYQEAYNTYATAKEESTRLYKIQEEKEGKVVEALQLAGKTKYFVEGVGTVYFIDKYVVPTPKTIADKQALFDYLKERHGEIFLMDKLGINHASLQKIYRDEMQEMEEAGMPQKSIPGLEMPTHMRSLGLRKA